MKKTLLAAALLLTSLSANAYRQEYYNSRDWEVAFLELTQNNKHYANECYIQQNAVGFSISLSYIRFVNAPVSIQLSVNSPAGLFPTGKYPVEISAPLTSYHVSAVMNNFYIKENMGDSASIASFDERIRVYFETSELHIKHQHGQLIVPVERNLDTAFAFSEFDKCVNQHLTY